MVILRLSATGIIKASSRHVEDKSSLTCGLVFLFSPMRIYSKHHAHFWVVTR